MNSLKYIITFGVALVGASALASQPDQKKTGVLDLVSRMVTKPAPKAKVDTKAAPARKWWSRFAPGSQLYGTLGMVGATIASVALLATPQKHLSLNNSSLPNNHVVSLLPIASLAGLGYLMSRNEDKAVIEERSKRSQTIWERILPSRETISNASYLMASGLFTLWGILLARPEIMETAQNFEFEKPTATFASLAYGAPKQFEMLREAIRKSEKFDEYGVSKPKGYLLTGNPGNGKTHLARALAGELGIPCIVRSGSDFINTYVGTGPANIRKLFDSAEEAAQASPSGKALIFIDEIDTIGGKRDAKNAHGSEKETLNALLTKMDGFTQSNVIVLAATNRPDSLDGALVRKGRFDKEIYIPEPSQKEREAMIQFCWNTFKKKKLLDNVAQWAARMVGWSNADIKEVVTEAGRSAVYEEASEIADNHLEVAVAEYERERKRKGLLQKSIKAFKQTSSDTSSGDERLRKLGLNPL